MSFITRDSVSPARMKTQKLYGLYEKFDKAWPKAKLAGVDVYMERMYYYVGGQFVLSKAQERFISEFMSLEELYSTPIEDDIDNMWFYMGPSIFWDGSVRPGGTPYEPATGPVPPTREEIVIYLNSTFKAGDIIEVTVSYGGALGRYINEHELPWEATGSGIVSGELNKDVIRNVLHEKPWYYFGNTLHWDYTDDNTIPFQFYDGNVDFDSFSAGELYASRDMPVTMLGATVSGYVIPKDNKTARPEYALGCFAVMGDTETFSPILNSDGELAIFNERVRTVSTQRDDGEALEYSYTVKYEYSPVTEASQIINEIVAYYEHWDNLSEVRSTARQRQVNKANNTLVKRSLSSMMSVPLTNSLYWFIYLRVDAARAMKKKDFVRLFEGLNTDYSVKPASVLEIVVAVVILIVAIVVAVVTYGAATEAAIAAGANVVVVVGGGIAAGAAMGGLVLSLGMMVLGGMGLSAGGLIRVIGAFAEVVGIVGQIAGLVTIIAGAVTAAAQEVGAAAGEEAVKKASVDATSEAGKEIVKNAAAEATKITVSNVVDIGMKVLENAFDSAVGSITEAFSSVGDFTSKKLLSYAQDALKIIDEITNHLKEEDAEKLKKETEAYDAEMALYEVDRYDNTTMAIADITAMMSERAASYDAIERLDEKIRRESADGWHDKWLAHTSA